MFHNIKDWNGCSKKRVNFTIGSIRWDFLCSLSQNPAFSLTKSAKMHTTQVINAPSSGPGLKGFLDIYIPNSEFMVQNEGDIPLK